MLIKSFENLLISQSSKGISLKLTLFFWCGVKQGDTKITFDCDQSMELGEYLINGVSHDKTIELSPLAVIYRLEQLGKLKPLPFEGKVLDLVEMLKAKFPDIDYATATNLIRPISLYCSALYVQVERLSEKSMDMQSLLTKNETSVGFQRKM